MTYQTSKQDNSLDNLCCYRRIVFIRVNPTHML